VVCPLLEIWCLVSCPFTSLQCLRQPHAIGPQTGSRTGHRNRRCKTEQRKGPQPVLCPARHICRCVTLQLDHSTTLRLDRTRTCRTARCKVKRKKCAVRSTPYGIRSPSLERRDTTDTVSYVVRRAGQSKHCKIRRTFGIIPVFGWGLLR
jgi:hypothetical protein